MYASACIMLAFHIGRFSGTGCMSTVLLSTLLYRQFLQEREVHYWMGLICFVIFVRRDHDGRGFRCAVALLVVASHAYLHVHLYGYIYHLTYERVNKCLFPFPLTCDIGYNN